MELPAGTHELQLRVDLASSPKLTVAIKPGGLIELYCEPSVPDERGFIAGWKVLKAMTLDRKRWITLRVEDTTAHDGTEHQEPD